MSHSEASDRQTAANPAEEALQVSEERLRLAMAAGRFGIWEWEIPTGRVFWSPEIFQILEVDPREFTGAVDQFNQLIHPEDRERFQDQIDRTLRGEGDFETEFRVVRPHGGIGWMMNRGTVVRDADGAPLRMVGIISDITERKKIEDSLREADQRKNDFLAMLSHELRNPLGPIRNAVHFLRLSGPPEPQLARAFDMIDRQVLHMSRLVDELLDVSRIARGRIVLRKDRCDLCRIVRDTSEDYRNTLEANGLMFELRLPSEPLWTCGDETRLSQVVSNVLHNAGKFTESGGRVTVSLEDGGDGKAVLRVRDTGIGIAPAMIPRLFEPFSLEERGKDRSRGGLGLGLTLVKGLVELHGGTVTAASPGLGHGTEITVRLPLDPEVCEDREEIA